MMQWIKKTLLFFSCFVWTQQLLSLSNLSFLQNIHKERILKRKNTQSTPNNKKPKKPSLLQCPLCKKGCSSTQYLERHLAKKVCQRDYTCTIFPCKGDKHFSSRKNLAEHMIEYKNLHNQCTICKEVFSAQQHLQIHLEKNVCQRNYTCTIFPCKGDKHFSSRKNLAEHIIEYKNLHNQCASCKEVFSSQQHLQIHLARKTCQKNKTNPYPFSCSFCIAHPRYHLQKNLNRHIMANHLYYQCKYKDCNEAFMIGSLLHQHIEKKHGLPSLLCSECSQSFHGLLTLYQHRYIEHKKCDKNTFIKFLKDFIEKHLRCSSYPYQQNLFFKALFLERQVLINNLLSPLETTIGDFAIPIEILPLYKQFIENITSRKNPALETLSLNVLLSYEYYRLSFFHDSTIGLLFLKDILSIMIQIRYPLKTTYKEMLDILYTNQFSDQYYRLFIQQFKKIFFNKRNTSEQRVICEKDFLFAGALQTHEDGLGTESIVIDKTLEYPNISLQESMNPKQWDDQSGVSKEYLLPPEQVVIGGEFPSVNTVCTNEYDLKNIENDLNDFHQGNFFPFENNDELRTPAHSVGRDA